MGGPVLRVTEVRNAYTILVEKPADRRPLRADRRVLFEKTIIV
jgi:hypothetical protein